MIELRPGFTPGSSTGTAGTRGTDHGVCVLADGAAIRRWAECLVATAEPAVIRCATFAVGAPALNWLTELVRQCGARLELLSDDGQHRPGVMCAGLLRLIED